MPILKARSLPSQVREVRSWPSGVRWLAFAGGVVVVIAVVLDMRKRARQRLDGSIGV